jgi:hypothetical protein
MEFINSVYTSNSVECNLKKEFELEASGEKCTDRPDKASSSSTAVQDVLEDNSNIQIHVSKRSHNRRRTNKLTS